MEHIAGDELAELVMDAYVGFESKLHDKGRRFPASEFRTFFDAVVRYVEATKESNMIHRNVAGAVNGLKEILELKSSRVSGRAIADADRLECMLSRATILTSKGTSHRGDRNRFDKGNSC